MSGQQVQHGPERDGQASTHQSDPGLAVLITLPIDIFGTEQAEASGADDVLEEVKVGISDDVVRESGDGRASRPRDDGDNEDGPKKSTWNTDDVIHKSSA